VIESLIEKCDKIFVGGGMIFTFYRAMGLSVGNSMVRHLYTPIYTYIHPYTPICPMFYVLLNPPLLYDTY
jgi:hypothetical protein